MHKLPKFSKIVNMFLTTLYWITIIITVTLLIFRMTEINEEMAVSALDSFAPYALVVLVIGIVHSYILYQQAGKE